MSAKPRSATQVMFGFDFQSNAAIILMIDNMSELSTIRIEGEEDIEIMLSDGSFVLAQAKSVVHSSTDFSNVRAKAIKALESLSEAAKKLKASELVYVTNSPDPLKDRVSRTMFYGPSRVSYDNLPPKTQRIISDYLSQIQVPLDTTLLRIQVIPFETDDEQQRYKVVLEHISDFIGTLGLDAPGLKKRLHEVWQMMLDKNGTKADRDIKLTKKDVIWPIIAFVTGRGQLKREAQYCTDLDDSDFDEVERRYREIIEDYSERYEIVVKVISDFVEKNLRGRDAIVSFVNENWGQYVELFGLTTVEDTIQNHLTKIILYTILGKRREINKIKQAVNL